MSTASRTALRRTTSDLHVPMMKWKDRSSTSPDSRNVVWTEPPHKPLKKVVPVVYYLSRNGQLQHPHFIEVPLSSPDHGLYLRDVINRLNSLRGKGMASMYSWSCKRSYKSGYVWHDLAENDYIYPAHGHEYVLKGSELLEGTLMTLDSGEALGQSSSTEKLHPETDKHGGEEDFPAAAPQRRRHQSWSSFDIHEYRVYKTESTGESSSGQRVAADASTQTDDKRRRSRRRAYKIAEDEEDDGGLSTELGKHEISPPPSDSSPETLETLLKADGKLLLHSRQLNQDLTPVSQITVSKSKASSSSVWMQFLSCGAMSFKDCGPGKENGFSLLSHYKGRLPRGRSTGAGTGSGSGSELNPENDDTVENSIRNIRRGKKGQKIAMEDKEYFSGSLIETKRSELPALKRSSSYNADRSIV